MHDGAPRRISLYEACIEEGTGLIDTRWQSVLFGQLREDLRVLSPSSVADLLNYACSCGIDEDSEAFAEVLRVLRGRDASAYRSVVEE